MNFHKYPLEQDLQEFYVSHLCSKWFESPQCWVISNFQRFKDRESNAHYEIYGSLESGEFIKIKKR